MENRIMNNQKQSKKILDFLFKYGVYLLYAALFIGLAAISIEFIAPINLVQLLIHASSVIVICVGNVFVLLIAGIDMSVGSVAFLASAIVSTLLTHYALNPYLAILILILVGVLFGFFNGILVKKYNIYPLIPTLGILFAGRGIGQYLVQKGVRVLPRQIRFFGVGSLLGIPVPIIIAFVFLVVGQLVLTKTSFGRQIVAIGDNEQAAVKSGIRVGTIKMIAYMISGFSAGVTGLIMSARVGSVYPNTAYGLEFTVLVSLVVGGVSLFGAVGSVFPGAFIGALFLSTIFNGLVVINASPYLFPVFQGVLVFIAILVNTINTRKVGEIPGGV